MRGQSGLVVGTAGHIDHGKTSLVYALTGIDTDRLKEEKKRGISIDLGFAEMQLANGVSISFVDVPGHERFVRNMLAGAAGMEAVLLIVASNESVMPQTREHFEICRLLGLCYGVIVLTKCDLATTEQLAQARRDVRQLVAGSFLANAPVVEASAVTRAGLPELTQQLAQIAAHESSRDGAGVVRMPIDRSFAAKGFGTVVTGTLAAGVVSVGDTLEVHPEKVKVRVRGLQSQHTTLQQANAGQRVAMNLAGIEHQAIKRGQLVAAADAFTGTQMIDVELGWLDANAPPSARELFVVHVGTAEVTGRVMAYNSRAERPRFARLRLMEEVIALPGDRFVIRRPSPAQTVGGGIVMDAFPPRRLNRVKTLARLETLSRVSLSAGALGRRIELLVGEAEEGSSMVELVRMTGASRAQLSAAMAETDGLVMSGNERAVSKQWIERKRRAVTAWLREFHKTNPNAAGAPLAAARLGMDAGLTALVFKGFEAVQVQGELVALAAHKAQFSPQEVAALQKMEQLFRTATLQPPSLAEAVANAGVEAKKARALLEALVKSNRLVRLPDDLIFHADAIAQIRTSLAQQKGRRFSVAEFKTWTNASRKFAIPLLEYLDQQRITKREGDVRVVL